MASSDLFHWAEAKAEIVALAADLREMVRLRGELAWLEICSAIESIRRLVIVLTAAAIMALAGLPLLLVAAAQSLDRCLGLSQHAWLIVMGLALVGLGAVTGGLAWWRFRNRFAGLEETLEELREDLVLWDEWNERSR